MVAQFSNSSKNPANLTIDQVQASIQLELLGYGKGESVYVRAFYHKDDPRAAADNGRKSNRLNFRELEKWQRQGRGVYFVVNGGGQTNEDVQAGRAIFYEHDKLDKKAQLCLWESLGLPVPTFQIDTGGKSIHSYWVFENPIPVKDWKVLQFDLLEFSDGDRKIKNESRVMRLAGAWHISPTGTVQTRIVSSSGKRYSYEELRTIIPEKETLPSPQAQSQAVPKIPLHHQEKTNIRWNDRDYARSYLEALKPDRVDDYDDWRTIGMVLKSIDESLFPDWDKWSQQSSKYKPGECQRKWETFKGTGVNIGTLAYLAKLDGWVSPFKNDSMAENHIRQRKLSRAGNGGGSDDATNNIVSFPSVPIDIEVVKEDIRDFLLTDYSQSDLVGKKVELRATYPRLSEREISQLFEVLAKEKEQANSRQDLESEINNLLQLNERSLDLNYYLPPELSEPLKLYCKWLNIRPEVVLTTVLATASSLHTVGTKLVISQKRDFTVSPNMFCAVIAESGQKKSPIFRTFAKKPLRQLKAEAQEFYLEQYKQYEDDYDKWSNEKSEAQGKGEPYNEPEPKQPSKPAPFYFNHATGEGITAAAAANPDKTLFALVDELAGYFKSQDSYRGGKGSDKQEVLSYHDGEGKTVLRAGGLKADVDEIYLSIFGTIQPAVAKRMMGSGDDEDGQWARFFFAQQPLAPTFMDDDDDAGSINLHERITAVYRNCFEVPKQEYTLSFEAFKLYVPFYNQLEKLRVSHPNLGIRAIYSKAEGHTGVLALNLHCLAAAAIGVRPGTEISADTMRRAIALMKFYIGQSKLLHSNVQDNLAAHYLRIIELSKRSEMSGKGGWISPRSLHDAKIQAGDKKARASDYRGWFTELVRMRKGQTRGDGNTLEFNYKMPDLPLDGENGEVVGKEFPHPEPLIYKDYMLNGENGENGELFSKNEDLLSNENTSVQEPIKNGLEAETFSENLPHFPHFPHLASNDQPVSVSDGEDVSPQTSPFPHIIINDAEQGEEVNVQIPETVSPSPHAPSDPEQVSNEVIANENKNDGDRTNGSDVDQVAGTNPKQVETAFIEPSDQCAKDNSSPFTIGDLVAASDPYEKKYKWNGTVREISSDGMQVRVYWRERENTAVNCLEWHDLAYLRLLAQE